MCALRITGGGATLPNSTPVLDMGLGRPDGWFEAWIEKADIRTTNNPGSPIGLVENDQIRIGYSSGEFAQDYYLRILVLPRNSEETPNISITSNGGLTLAGDKLLSQANRVSEEITISTNYRSITLEEFGSVKTNGEPSYEYVGLIKGSLAKHCMKEIINRTGSGELNLFDNYSDSHSSGSYSRNINCWAYNLRNSMTGISVWNSESNSRKAGILLDVRNSEDDPVRRYVAFAAHYAPKVGTKLRFITEDNQTITRTIIGKKRHPNYHLSYGPMNDITVALLDLSLPESIAPIKLLPDSYLDYLPEKGENIPALCMDQEEKALIHDIRELSSLMVRKYPRIVALQNFYEDVIPGDSGNGVFVVIDGEVVALSMWSTTETGTFLSYKGGTVNQLSILKGMIDDLNSEAEETLPSNYTINTVDLSAYPNFSTKNYIIEDNDVDNGNASLWVKSDIVNGKMSYKMREDVNNGWLLQWTGNAWETSDFGNPTISHPNDSSSDDVITPDLATFSTLNFETP